MRYMGLQRGEAEVLLKIHEPSGMWIFFPKVRTIKRTILVNPGTHTFDFHPISGSDDGMWDTGNYTIEIIVDGETRAKKQFYVK